MSSELYAATPAGVLPLMDNWRKISVEGKQVSVVYREAIGKTREAAIIIQEKQLQRVFEDRAVQSLRKNFPGKGRATLGINIPHGKPIEVAPEKQLEQVLLLLKDEGISVAYVILYGGSAAKLFEYFIASNVQNINGILLISSFAKKKEKL